MSYDRLVPRIVRSGLTLEELLARYLNVAIVVNPVTVPRVVADDANDDQLLACALAAQADLIGSGDSDLLALREYQGIRIVDAAAAVTLIEQQ